jgi:hypothetical protein
MFAKQDQSTSVPMRGRIVIQDTLSVLYSAGVAAAWAAAIIYLIWFF